MIHRLRRFRLRTKLVLLVTATGPCAVGVFAAVALRESGRQQESLAASFEQASLHAGVSEFGTRYRADNAADPGANLLALNAPVEAARAGEPDKGFEAGVVLAEDVMRLFGQIHRSSDQVAELLGKVAAATANESKSLQVVARAVENLDQVTQTNTSSSEELAAADCRSNLQALQKSIERFQVNMNEGLA